MTTTPFSPKLIKGGIVLVDPTTAQVQRVIALQYNAESLKRELKGQDVGGELELQRQDEPAAEAEANARKAGLVIPHPRRQPEGLAKPYHHAGDGDDLQQQLEQLDPVHHALFQARYLKH